MSELLKNIHGSCLCGAVKFEVQEMDPHFGACHCSVCRKWGGGPLLAMDCGDQVTFQGEASIGRFESSEWAERGFCTTCGSHLFFHLLASGQYIMPIGLFDIDEHAQFDHQIFIEQKPNYYQFANDTALLTGDQVFAEFSDDHEDDHDHS